LDLGFGGDFDTWFDKHLIKHFAKEDAALKEVRPKTADFLQIKGAD
jgi:hypothetical protein